jgi:hypothetical protein
MEYIEAIILIWIFSLCAAWGSAKMNTERELSKKWTLGITYNSDGILKQPMLERHLGYKGITASGHKVRGTAWEYIFINEENMDLIRHVAYFKTPFESNPYLPSKEDPLYKMLQDMVNREHGKILGIEKEPLGR